MQAARPALPLKTREIQNCIRDSARWNGLNFCEGDIVLRHLCPFRHLCPYRSAPANS